jgi:SWI/SNF-related matrix-associated actin-dependent regulator 1 of chromatin subfamily A
MTDQVDVALNWSKPAARMTVQGERLVSTASPNPAFWALWREQKEVLRAAGYSVKKDGERWTVVRYQPLNAEMLAEKAVVREASRATDAAIDIPAPEGLAYLPYQRAGIAWAASRPASLIADEMGLGKTIQAVGVINASPDAKRILVICPASLRLNWARELSKWLVTPRAICVIESGKTKWPASPEIVIVNYDLLKKFRKELRLAQWCIVIADECHAIKNSKAQRTKEIVGYRPKDKDKEGWSAIPAARRIFLTGTPIVNRPVELWPIINFLDPGSWRNFFSYAKQYCGAVHNGFGWDFGGASNLQELQDRLRETVMVRRLKADVLTELPPKRRQVLPVPANGAEACIAAERAAEARHEQALIAAQVAAQLAKAAESDADYDAAVAKLRDLSNAAFAEISQMRHDTALAKAPYVVEHVLAASGKVVVFAHHRDVIQALRDGLEAEHPRSVVTLTGEDSMQSRQDAVDRFQSDEECRYFIGSIRAAGVGLTLTASSHVVFGELDWTPGAMSQAEDRCHRIGQTNSVLIQHIVLDGSIDARLANTLVSKQTVIDCALDKPSTEPEVEYDDSEEGRVLRQRQRDAQDNLDLDVMMEAAAERDAARRKADAEQRSTSTKPIKATRPEIAEIAEKLTDAQIAAIHMGLRVLNSVNADGARILNGVGFNRIDSGIGADLAERATLTKRQAALGAKILRKYKRQLGSDLYAAIYSEVKDG